MGSGISPGACNAYMESFECKALESCPPPLKPSVWLRYVDDVVEAINKNQVQDFTSHINNINPSIQFTVELQTTNSQGTTHLPVLDVDIERKTDGSSKFKIYRKSTHTDQYLNFNSHHPLNQKLGVIRTLFDRAETLITEDEDKRTEIENVKKALRLCQYPDWTFKRVEEQMKSKKDDQKIKKKNNDKTKQDNNTRSFSITLPYVKGLSEATARIFKKYNRSTCFRPSNKLGQQLFRLKDKADPTKKANAIYQIPCKNCEKVYIGETARPLYVRLNEHQTETDKISDTKTFTRLQRKESTSADFKSAIAEHATTNNHVIDNAKSLEQVDDWKLRGIKEAIHIRSNPVNMNRPQGERHLLSNVWDSLLQADAASQRHGRGAGSTSRGPKSGSVRTRGRGPRGRGKF